MMIISIFLTVAGSMLASNGRRVGVLFVVVVADYLQQLETEGVIVKTGRGYALAAKIGGAA